MNGTVVVFKKELLDTIRDRRPLIAAVLVPPLLFRWFLIGGTWLATSRTEAAAKETLRVAVLGSEDAEPPSRSNSKSKPIPTST